MPQIPKLNKAGILVINDKDYPKYFDCLLYLSQLERTFQFLKQCNKRAH